MKGIQKVVHPLLREQDHYVKAENALPKLKNLLENSFRRIFCISGTWGFIE
jgi:hypothetical protein